MSALAEAIEATRARNYRDPDDEPAAVDWDDPVTRAAVALDTLSYETPERVLMMLTGSREQMQRTWGAEAARGIGSCCGGARRFCSRSGAA